MWSVEEFSVVGSWIFLYNKLWWNIMDEAYAFFVFYLRWLLSFPHPPQLTQRQWLPPLFWSFFSLCRGRSLPILLAGTGGSQKARYSLLFLFHDTEYCIICNSYWMLLPLLLFSFLERGLFWTISTRSPSVPLPGRLSLQATMKEIAEEEQNGDVVINFWNMSQL